MGIVVKALYFQTPPGAAEADSHPRGEQLGANCRS